MRASEKLGRFAAFLLSLGAHGVAYASLTGRPSEPAPEHVVSTVDFEVPAPRAPEPPPPPERPPPPPPARAAVAAAPKPASPVAAAPAPPSAPPNPIPTPTLSGVTLNADDNSGFAMPVGDGSALHGSIGLGSSVAPPAPLAAVTPVLAPLQPALIAVRDLSERPKPPSLASVLRQNFPDDARRRGLSGTAKVRARIDADGVIRGVSVVSETSPGFGPACQRTVKGSHWSTPRDKNGGAVATEIVYTCHFEVDQ